MEQVCPSMGKTLSADGAVPPIPFPARSQRRLSWPELSVLGILLLGLSVVTIFAVRPDVIGRTPPLCSFRWLGGHCPGCGMTRACALLLRLDLPGAMRHYPLVVFGAPFLALQLADLLLTILAGRKLVERWPNWFSAGFQALFVAGFSGLAALRIVAWFWPSSGLGMFCPPDPIG